MQEIFCVYIIIYMHAYARAYMRWRAHMIKLWYNSNHAYF